MSTTFRRYAPDQTLLLPADLREWLPEGHLAHYVSDLVDGLGSMSFNPGSARTPSHDDPLEDSVLIRLTETAPARVASTSALEPPLRTGKSSAAC